MKKDIDYYFRKVKKYKVSIIYEGYVLGKNKKMALASIVNRIGKGEIKSKCKVEIV